jgi:hypothetical protein
MFSTGVRFNLLFRLTVYPPRVLLVGGFAISAFILSSISFVHTGADARLDGSSRALNLPHFLSCRHFGFSFRIHSLRRLRL